MDASGSTRRLTPSEVCGPRLGDRRDRRGRGLRGPAVLPGPLSAGGVPLSRSRRELFDNAVLDVAERLERRWHDRLGLLEFAVEETPILPESWSGDSVPLASTVPGSGGAPTRLVVFRRPIELRCGSRAEVDALVLTVMVEQVAELLGVTPEEVDPDYDPDRDAE